jgi:hypothetical protein
MNTINVSSGFSPFQLHMGHSPCLIPPIAPALAEEASSDIDAALGFVTGIPRVGNFNTVPAPVYTVPVLGTGTYRTRSAAVSYETRGIFSTRGLLA